MSFDEVYLVGKNHNYEQKGTPGALVYLAGDEKNRFVQGYYKKGVAWRTRLQRRGVSLQNGPRNL